MKWTRGKTLITKQTAQWTQGLYFLHDMIEDIISSGYDIGAFKILCKSVHLDGFVDSYMQYKSKNI